MAMPMPWVSILIRLQRDIIRHKSIRRLCRRFADAVSLCSSMTRSMTALILAFVLSLSSSFGLLAQPPQHKHRKKKPPAPPCRTGCKPETEAPQVATDTPEDGAAQKELAALVRDLRNGGPGAYAKLSTFATTNTTNVWGARAALALGYEDFSKKRFAQALGWLMKGQNDKLLREYALYWTAQAQFNFGRAAETYKVLQTLLHDYPTTALRDQALQSFAPAAVQTGHAQDAVDALNAYAATSSKPELLIERARAYQATHQLPRAAKDYQTIFYKFPMADEAKPASAGMTQMMHALGREYSYPGVEMQEQRAQIFYDAHKWREARTEFEKLLTMLKDPANPVRQRAQLRAAECRVQKKGSPSLIASLKTPDLDVDAERLYALSQAYRAAKKETEMFNALNSLAQTYPVSKWNEDGLMAAGNYHWV